MVLVGLLLTACTNENSGDQHDELASLQKELEDLKQENETLKKTIDDQKNTMKQLEESSEAIPEKEAESSEGVIKATVVENYPKTLFQESSIDLDEDGEEEQVELYVDAEQLDNGEIAWDDGQMWLLVVKDGEETYPLFHDFVQLGTIDFTLATLDDKPAIVMLKTWHSNKTIQKFQFQFDHNEKVFQSETLLEKNNMLSQYNEPTSYALFEDGYKLLRNTLTEKVEVALASKDVNLEDNVERNNILGPILADLYHADRLFETAQELNPEMSVSLNSVILLVEEMMMEEPIEAQWNKLQYIQEVFLDNEIKDYILEETNQIHPDLQEQLRRMENVIVGEK